MPAAIRLRATAHPGGSPTFVSASTAATGGSGGTTLNVAVPSGVAVGDKMLLFVFNQPLSNGAPTGWTTEVVEFTGPGVGGSFNSRASAYSKTVVSGDIGATVTMTFNVGGSAGATLGLIVAYRGVSTIDVKASSSTQSSSYSAPRPTTTGTNARVVHAAVSHVPTSATTPTVTLDAAFAQRATIAQGTTGNDAKTAVVGDLTQAIAGQTVAATDTDAGASNEWLGFTFALR